MGSQEKKWPSWEQVAAALPPGWIQAARWFRRKSERVKQVRYHESVELTPFAPPPSGRMALLLVEAVMESGRLDLYQVPVLLEQSKPNTTMESGLDAFPVKDGFHFREATSVPAFQTAVLRLMAARQTLAGARGVFRFENYPVKALRQCRPLAQTSSNSLVLVRGDDVVKYIRGLDPGVSPELEMNRFFASNGDFTNLPPLTGSLSYVAEGGPEYTLAIALRFIENDGDLWAWTQEYLARFLADLPSGGGPVPTETVDCCIAEYARPMGRLAGVMAQMHQVLTSGEGGLAFQSEPVSQADLTEWSAMMVANAQAIFGRISTLAPGDSPVLQEFFRGFARMRERALAALDRLPGLNPRGWLKSRVHGDFHLGQVLKAGDDFYIIDFEGEPQRKADQRTARYSPIKDVAGLLRSFNYAVYAALFTWAERAQREEAELRRREAALLQWNAGVERAFWQSYLNAAGLVETADLNALAALLKLEKAIYELDYEINNRPNWLKIPVSGIGACLEEVFHDATR